MDQSLYKKEKERIPDPSEHVRLMVKGMNAFLERDESRNSGNHISARGTCGVDHLNEIPLLGRNKRMLCRS